MLESPITSPASPATTSADWSIRNGAIAAARRVIEREMRAGVVQSGSSLRRRDPIDTLVRTVGDGGPPDEGRKRRLRRLSS